MQRERQISEIFAEAIEYYMEKKGLTYQRLGDETGLSPAYIYRIRKGIRQAPSVPVAVRLIKSLQIPKEMVLSLLELNNENPQEQNDLYELLLFQDYTIGEKEVNIETKRKLSKLIQFAIECEWSMKSLASDLVALSEKVSDLKEHL
ncbi:helix-turn-helix domain-containing protein [Neobacillus drentensis]|uniref:helix-turn-helix domain-containing protein n=1 Tax=Neobacillus drentensis TaxID=220684 RepID=UPI002FFF1D55